MPFRFFPGVFGLFLRGINMLLEICHHLQQIVEHPDMPGTIVNIKIPAGHTVGQHGQIAGVYAQLAVYAGADIERHGNPQQQRQAVTPSAAMVAVELESCTALVPVSDSFVACSSMEATFLETST